jgi:surface protein
MMVKSYNWLKIMNYNIHGYIYNVGDFAWVLSIELVYRSGKVAIVSGIVDDEMSYEVLMDDTGLNETHSHSQLYPLLSYAELAKQRLVTPTPTITSSPTPAITRTPKATQTPTPTPSSSATNYPDLTDGIMWTATNGSIIINNDNSLQFKSNFNNNGSVNFTAPLNLSASQIYEFYVRFNEGTCQFIRIELDLQDGSPIIVFNLKEQFSGSFRSSFKTTSNTSGGTIKVYLFDSPNYALPAAKGTTYNFSIIDVKQLPVANVPTPTPSVGSSTPFTLDFTEIQNCTFYGCGASNSASIDWGDGNVDSIPDGSGEEGDVGCDSGYSHVYDAIENYTVKIYGNYVSIGFDMDEGTTVAITDWGNNIINYYSISSNITDVPTTLSANITNIDSLFGGNTVFAGDISGWDTSNVTSMSGTFADSTINQDISSWNTSNVTNMNGMFSGASAFNQDISGWNTGNVSDMSYMFVGSGFNGDISGWDTHNVLTMSNMFANNTIFNGDISSWDTSTVTAMDHMFANNTIFNGDISGWNVSSVTDMNNMFSGSSAFTQDLTAWDTSSVIDMSYMFGNEFGDVTIYDGDISGWDVSSVTTMAHMFARNATFNANISGWNTGNVTSMSNMFSASTSFNQNIGSWNVHNVTDMTLMFNGASIFNQNLSGWCVTNIPTLPGGFKQNTPAWTQPKPVWGTCPP